MRRRADGGSALAADRQSPRFTPARCFAGASQKGVIASSPDRAECRYAVADIECIALGRRSSPLGLDDVVIETETSADRTPGGYLAKPTDMDAVMSPPCHRDGAAQLRLDSKGAKVRKRARGAAADGPPQRRHRAPRGGRRGLVALGVQVRENKRMVRGLDYYRGPVFEALTEKLGAQAAVLAGGRYDGLLETVGGPDVAAVGFAGGTERLLLVAQAHGRSLGAASPDLGVVAAPGADHHTVLRWVCGLRASRWRGRRPVGPSVKAQMKDEIERLSICP